MTTPFLRALRFWPLLLLGLTAGTCGDPPEPTPPRPENAEQCTMCHRGIEPIHNPQALANVKECTFCHGGNGYVANKSVAHVPVPDNWAEVRGDGLPDAPHGYIKDMTPNQLAQLDAAYVKFINPSDIRVVDETCGVCHPNETRAQKNSIMTTNAGHYMPTLYLAGFQDREAIYGSWPATDPDCTGEPGLSCEVVPLNPPLDDEIQAALDDPDPTRLEEIAYQHYLAKSCNTCHAAGYGKNNSPHLYRSAGCAACHVLYGPNGVYEGADPTIPNAPVYPKEHRITKAIPTEQCGTCHFQGGRIGLLFRGIREGGFADTPPNAEPWNESAYGHGPGYYFFDEDTTNDIDETPPDVHYEAGMHCADCHVGSDVHGTGRIASTSKYQVDIRCEDCHGTIDTRRRPDAAGVYKTLSNRSLPQLSTGPDNEVILTGIVDGKTHVVKQVADLQTGAAAIHARDGNDWSHTDDLTCDTCHTSYNQYCIGCHVTMDMRLEQVDHQTGLKTTGLVSGSRDFYDLDHVLLGLGRDGRAMSVMPSQQVQMQIRDYDGELVFGEQVGDEVLGAFRTTPGSDANIGFATFFQHTTSRGSRSCSTCHRTDDSQEEWDRVRGVYGFGTGEYMLPNPLGPDVDALQFLAPDGTPITEWTHTGTGPLPEARRDRALSVVVE